MTIKISIVNLFYLLILFGFKGVARLGLKRVPSRVHLISCRYETRRRNPLALVYGNKIFTEIRNTKISLIPRRLKNIRFEGWGEILRKMRKFWLDGKATTLETSYWKNVNGSDQHL